ncbi:MAG TPA: M1 family metallopeptidase, partial [Flavisolibacter sp.]|nr:M1 family metallopeptidase [Flavisolibacter sp.]
MKCWLNSPFQRAATLVFTYLFVFLSSYAQKPFDIQHYRFEIQVSDRTDSIYGTTVVRIKASEPFQHFELDLVQSKNGKGMYVQDVMNTSAISNLLRFRHDADRLVIQFRDTVKKGETREVAIKYAGIPKDGLIISKNKHDDRTFFADNWPNRAHHWIPCVDAPDDKASFEFVITAPAHYQVISNGVKVGDREVENGRRLTHWREDIPLSTKIMVIGVARFAVKTFPDSPKDIPVSAWVYPQDSAKGFYDYALATDILQFFSNYIAPYPYKKLANVQSKTIFGGMENASAIFYSETSVTGDRSSEDLIAHEIVHQWFGNMASEKYFSHLWLSEGFATYLTNVYIEQKYGRDSMNQRLQQDRAAVIKFLKTKALPVVDSVSKLMELLNANSYQKGSWFLHMLRNRVGDNNFQKIIQAYYNEFKGSN